MKKKNILAIVIVLAMGMTACSSEPKEGEVSTGTVMESKITQEENTETKPANEEAMNTEPANTEAVNAEPVNTETPEAKAAENDGKEDSGEVEISQGDPIVGTVERYVDDIIVISDYGVLIYFSTKDAEIVEGDSPIAAGDIVEITYKGVQGDEEHPGMAIKVVAESMMYNTERDDK